MDFIHIAVHNFCNFHFIANTDYICGNNEQSPFRQPKKLFTNNSE